MSFNNVASIDAAKGFYRKLLLNRSLSNGLKFTTKGRKLPKATSWLKFIAECHQEEDQHGEYVSCPSPWHAALYAIYYMASVANDDFEPDIRRQIAAKLSVPSIPPFLTLFRGHKNPSWKIESYLYRQENSASCKSAHDRFCAVLKKIVDKIGLPFIDELALTATAQHYGIPTDLLDLSLDPLTSINFANRPGDGDIGTLFMISQAKLDNMFSSRMIFPPAFVERLYLQRGIFAEFDYARADEFRKECIEIRFTKHVDFHVIRGGKEFSHELLLSDDGFLQAFATECFDWAKIGNRFSQLVDCDSHVETLAINLSKRLPAHLKQAMYQDAIGLWTQAAHEMFEGMAFVRLRGELKLTENIIERFILDNPKLAALLASYYYGQFIAFHGQWKMIRWMPWNWFGSDSERRTAYAYQSARWFSHYFAEIAAGRRILTHDNEVAIQKEP